ncbi:DUF1554 domain-containing protein [Nannocystis punicea]|uniref:DUF1554 domain-containing protein n=1 Tax=Nannocystis punicea TaxID=2995304 RepID=A0ABY7H625_9BACT|nr:DUF1554 domain-containing protein [Nannocystis poenicansa]WAS94535.1 DUF1554 domain-containing protein [Nannocystis poenicansa]
MMNTKRLACVGPWLVASALVAGCDSTVDITVNVNGLAGGCGDGILGPGEQCDDGEANGPDAACRSNCAVNTCGDGDPGPDEECDDGPDNAAGAACKVDCTSQVCGDGDLGAGEECDEGDDNGEAAACTPECTLQVCGDGFVGAMEGCDDGDDDDADECSNDCVAASCGDGEVQVGEACDDGNAIDTDACTSSCTVAACGDGFVQAGEACDEGAANSDHGDCTLACAVATCGDGLVHDAGDNGWETCDDGPLNGPDQACLQHCMLNVCGDGYQAYFEECDDGDAEGGDGCSATCTAEWCGNEVVDVGEECDDGLTEGADDGCNQNCAFPSCGDGFVQPSLGEECDQGWWANDNSGYCTLACKEFFCGDGFVRPGFEQCDLGPDNGPGQPCDLECNGAVCGDGVVAPGEDCDDGDTEQNGLCNADCTWPHRVFVTSTTYNGNLGGLAGAQAKCQARADAADLGGTWDAWIGTASSVPADRFPLVLQSYVRLDGVEVAPSTWALLTSNLTATIHVNEYGQSIAVGNTWTGLNADGSLHSSTCQNWTSTSGYGRSGRVDYTNGGWTSQTSEACSFGLRLYCFEP